MKHLVKIYEDNFSMLERFITSTLLRFNNRPLEQQDIDSMFKLFTALELLYTTDKNLVQTSPNLERNGEMKAEHVGVKREYLLYNKKGTKRQDFSEGNDIVIKPPYISSTTGHLCVTVIQKREEDYIFLDFELEKLLKRFGLYDSHKAFEHFIKFFYALISISLLGVAIFLSGYGVYTFAENFSNPSMEAMFKPVVALTLGLAIFDLGKTIFEQEVLSSDNYNETFKPKTLINFTVSIIIALMIEALLMVFKISINNYHDLIYSLYLIIGSSLLFITFSTFYYLYKKSKRL